MEKARFMALMEYRPNGKDIMVSVFYFEVVMVMLKDKKILHKKCNVNKNQFYALSEVDKSNVTSSFFSCYYHCQLVKSLVGGGEGLHPTRLPVSVGLYYETHNKQLVYPMGITKCNLKVAHLLRQYDTKIVNGQIALGKLTLYEPLQVP